MSITERIEQMCPRHSEADSLMKSAAPPGARWGFDDFHGVPRAWMELAGGVHAHYFEANGADNVEAAKACVKLYQDWYERTMEEMHETDR